MVSKLPNNNPTNQPVGETGQSSAAKVHPEVSKSVSQLEARIEQSTTSQLHPTAKPSQARERGTIHAKDMNNQDMYKNSLLEKVMLFSFLRTQVFGSEKDLSTVYEKSQFKAMLEGRGQGYGEDLAVHEKVNIPLRDKTITGYRFSTSQSSSQNRPVALIITGSWGPAGKYAAPLARGYLDKGFDVLVIDPVGFGASQKAGKPTPENFMQSAEAGAKYIKENMQRDNRKIVVHGYSLGGFAAAHVAGLEENQGMHVVLDRAGSSAGKIAEHTAGKIVGGVARQLTQKVVNFDLEKTLPKVTGKILVIQADSNLDEIEAPHKADTLVRKMVEDNILTKGMTYVTGQDGNHITIFDETWTTKKNEESVSHYQWNRFIIEPMTISPSPPSTPPTGA